MKKTLIITLLLIAPFVVKGQTDTIFIDGIPYIWKIALADTLSFTPLDTLEAILLISDTTTIRIGTALFNENPFAIWLNGFVLEGTWGFAGILGNDKKPLPVEFVVWDYKLLNPKFIKYTNEISLER